MKNFVLTTKMGEIITKVFCETLEEAITLLSFKKRLSSRDLLEIFDVKEI